MKKIILLILLVIVIYPIKSKKEEGLDKKVIETITQTSEK